MPAELNPHIAGAEQTYGIRLTLVVRPVADSDNPHVNEFLKEVAENITGVISRDSQLSLAESLVAIISEAPEQFEKLSVKISTDPGNGAEQGDDGGVFVRKGYASIQTSAAADTVGEATLNLPPNVFTSSEYTVSVAPLSDPGVNFRWWQIAKSAESVKIGFAASQNCNIQVSAQI